MKIVIIGQGNVACNLQEAFLRKQVDSQMVSSREGLEQIPIADCYIYAVRDAALQQVVDQVHVPNRSLHVHTSGTMPVSVFGADKPHAGIFYPFQSFSKAHLLEDFSNIPIFFEARQIDDVSAIYAVALTITTHIYETSQADRERLHAAGVFVNNFPNLLFGIAQEILSNTHIPFQALLPLIDETAQKVHTLTPLEAQTGPAQRNDQNIMDHHLSLLNEEQRTIYQLLSRAIQKRVLKDSKNL